MGVHNLKLQGCRPDLSSDGTRVTWGFGDYRIGIADLDLAGSPPAAKNLRALLTSPEPLMTYHMAWSPDGRYVAFSRGPQRPGKSLKGLFAQCPGIEAPGWDLCIADTSKENRSVHHPRREIQQGARVGAGAAEEVTRPPDPAEV